jgi:hypothetical protein
MDIQKLIKQLKARVEALGKKAQSVFKVSADTSKKALTVVTDNAQALAEVQTTAAKDVYEVAVASFNTAKAAGLKEVAAKPVEFLPAEGKDLVVTAAKQTVELLTSTGEELLEVLQKGYKSIVTKLQAKKAVRKPAARRSTARKTTTKKAAAAA